MVSAPPDTKLALRVSSFYGQGLHIIFVCYNVDETEIKLEEVGTQRNGYWAHCVGSVVGDAAKLDIVGE